MKGEIGATDPQGTAGVTGAKGETGPAPVMTVTENTPTDYKLNFKTDSQEILSPNLKSNRENYNQNLAALNSTASIPIGYLVLVIQNTSTFSVRLSVRPANVSTPILADIPRASISSTVVIDDLVYSQSQEMHWIRIRQEDPATKLWSMCEVRTFPSFGGGRTSVCANWWHNGTSSQSTYKTH